MSRRTVVPLVAGLLVLAVACADDDDAGEAGGDPSTAVTAPAVDGATTVAAAPSSSSDGTAPPTDATDAPVSAPAPADTSEAPDDPTPAPVTGAEPAVELTEIGTFDRPVDLAWRDGDEGLYIVSQSGTILRMMPDGSSSSVLDVGDLTVDEFEQGLLGMTFSPAGDLAYINYTDLEGNTTITEHPVDDDGTFGTGDSARTVLVIDQPYPNHNGGDLTFGPDGLLYIGMGDGGDGGDPERRATNMRSLLGKMLRIDPTPSGDLGYTVPADNPFVGRADAAPEIWSSGLRNPWRFSFDRETGDLWIADVGQNAVEEVDVVPASGGRDAGRGESFGWSALEGDVPFNDDVTIEDPVPPFFTYTHDDGSCSVSGGVRARGGPVADLVGWYVFGDYCTGKLWAIEVLGEGESLAAGQLVDLGVVPWLTAVVDGPDGEVYALSAMGAVARLDPAD